jgi:DNA-binding MarR family transcriptional regulator
MHHQDNDSEQLLFFLIRRISRSFRKRLNQSFARAGHDVTTEQWRILKCLQNKDGQRQQDLADVVHKDKTCITRIIDSMEKRDLVVRIPDRLDRRQKLIYLANKGKRLQEELMQIAQKTSLEVQQGIEPEHLDICRNVLTKIRSNLSDS